MKELHTFGGNVALVEALFRHDVRFLVIGGLALHYHVPEREADDLDVLVEQSIEVGGKVIGALASIGVDPGFGEERFAARPTRISLKFHALYADILTRPDFDEHWRQAKSVLLFGRVVRVASIGSLLSLLRDSNDPKHARDIELLRRIQQTTMGEDEER